MELFLLIAGMIALMGGRIVVTSNFSLEGDRARIFGALLIAPWVIAFASGVVIGGANPMIGTETAPTGNGLTGVFVFWGCVIAALLYAMATRQAEQIADESAKPANSSRSTAASKTPRARKAA